MSAVRNGEYKAAALTLLGLAGTNNPYQLCHTYVFWQFNGGMFNMDPAHQRRNARPRHSDVRSLVRLLQRTRRIGSCTRIHLSSAVVHSTPMFSAEKERQHVTEESDLNLASNLENGLD